MRQAVRWIRLIVKKIENNGSNLAKLQDWNKFMVPITSYTQPTGSGANINR